MPTVLVARNFEHGARLSTDNSSLDDTRLSPQLLEIITQAGQVSIQQKHIS